VQLLGPSPGPARSLTERSPPVTAFDTEVWAQIKTRVRSELQLRGTSLGVLAEETDLSRNTFEKVLSPKGVTPGRLVAEKLERWLSDRGTGNEWLRLPLTRGTVVCTVAHPTMQWRLRPAACPSSSATNLATRPQSR